MPLNDVTNRFGVHAINLCTLFKYLAVMVWLKESVMTKPNLDPAIPAFTSGKLELSNYYTHFMMGLTCLGCLICD